MTETDPVTSDTGWHVYRGESERHNGIARLPDPPQWRFFDGEVLQDEASDEPAVDSRPGAEARAKAYKPEVTVAERANAAIYLRRPLLVTGRPGTGKSTLAHSIAWELQLGPVLYWPITSRSQLQDSLYRYDAVGRLQEANLHRLDQDSLPTNPIGSFITLGPLGTALVARRRPRVLLIDEFDKSDIDLPNDLLNVFEEGQFTIPELVRESGDELQAVRLATEERSSVLVQGGLVRCRAFPIIIITSNGERSFPSAFLRRCVEVRINEPTEDKLAAIVRAQIGPDALSGNDDLFAEFLRQRESGTPMPTDHLLNAMYLANSDRGTNRQDGRNAALSLLEQRRSGDL